ncbi:hypothetical protein P8S73_08155 [Kocuria sp. ChxB]|uniref:hypothetical protein n=1 Tax=Kocuria sp. ChxB TaxID=3035474 RepID=UPI00279DDDE4|nr:hypothetical protein P8S73_08155 [Kocuria sp. ChxB]
MVAASIFLWAAVAAVIVLVLALVGFGIWAVARQRPAGKPAPDTVGSPGRD